MENNVKNPKFKVGDRIRISKYKNVFEAYTLNGLKNKHFVIKKVKNMVPWTYLIEDLN